MDNNKQIIRSESANPSDAFPIIPKGWGSFRILHEEKDSLTILVSLVAGDRMRYHSHSKRRELWIVVSGCGNVVINEINSTVNVGDIVELPAGSRHTVIATTELKLIEIQIGNTDISDKKIYDLRQNYYNDGSWSYSVGRDKEGK